MTICSEQPKRKIVRIRVRGTGPPRAQSPPSQEREARGTGVQDVAKGARVHDRTGINVWSYRYVKD
jgi:hypothetical protein